MANSLSSLSDHLGYRRFTKTTEKIIISAYCVLMIKFIVSDNNTHCSEKDATGIVWELYQNEMAANRNRRCAEHSQSRA